MGGPVDYASRPRRRRLSRPRRPVAPSPRDALWRYIGALGHGWASYCASLPQHTTLTCRHRHARLQRRQRHCIVGNCQRLLWRLVRERADDCSSLQWPKVERRRIGIWLNSSIPNRSRRTVAWVLLSWHSMRWRLIHCANGKVCGAGIVKKC